MNYPNLRGRQIILDTETTGLNWWESKVFGIAIKMVAGKEYYYDVREDDSVIPWLRDELSTTTLVIGHNFKFDMHMLANEGINFEEVSVIDTMIMAALVDEHEYSYRLDDLTFNYLGKRKEKLPFPIEELPNAPYEISKKYALRDVNLTHELHNFYSPTMDKEELWKVMYMEMDLLKELFYIERRGVRVDVDSAELAILRLKDIIINDQKELNQMAGFNINPNPSGSIHKLFNPREEDGRWVACDGTPLESTGKGKASIDANALRAMTHPAAAKILNLRKLKKLVDMFLVGHVLGHQRNGVVHANFNQTRSENDLGTVTGRMSVNKPALQQIPKRDKEMAAIIRKIFIPHTKDQEWGCYDYDQIDFRWFAHYVRNPDMDKMYKENPDTDFHQLVSDWTKLPRSARFAGDPNAKQINLGLIFGMGQGKLAKEMGLPYIIKERKNKKSYLAPGDEAKLVFRNYHNKISGAQELLNRATSRAKYKGYIKTYLGRRIRFPNRHLCYKAGGLLFQGSAADLIKLKTIELGRFLRSEGQDLVLIVHDEMNINTMKGNNRIREETKRIMEDFHIRIPIKVSAGIGDNWHEASK